MAAVLTCLGIPVTSKRIQSFKNEKQNKGILKQARKKTESVFIATPLFLIHFGEGTSVWVCLNAYMEGKGERT